MNPDELKSDEQVSAGIAEWIFEADCSCEQGNMCKVCKAQNEILDALQSVRREATLAERERAAKVSETWPCNCHSRYGTGKRQYHGTDCETSLGQDIGAEIRSRKDG